MMTDATIPRPVQRLLPPSEHLAIYLLAAVPTLIKLACYSTYPGSDDAFIHMTIVHNVTNLCGLPVLAAGEVL